MVHHIVIWDVVPAWQCMSCHCHVPKGGPAGGVYCTSLVAAEHTVHSMLDTNLFSECMSSETSETHLAPAALYLPGDAATTVIHQYQNMPPYFLVGMID